MGCFIHKKEASGVITVFLSLVLTIILSLVMTIIEGARVSTAKAFAERALTTAMDSVLAEFYAPLMEEYHILGLEAGYGGSMVKDEEIIGRLKEYTSYTFIPNQNLADSSARMELYDISLDTIQVKNYTGLMDYQGDLFLNECVEYMKYKELGNGIEALLDKVDLMEEPKRVSYLYEEKLKVEEELVVIDEGILNLMRLLDGVSTDKKGLKVNKDGSLKNLSDFAKKICYEAVTMENVGINNDRIFLALQSGYVDPSGYFLTMEEYFKTLEQTLLLQQELENKRTELSARIEKAGQELERLDQIRVEAKSKKEDTKVISAQLKEYKEYIQGLHEAFDSNEQEIYGCSYEVINNANEIMKSGGDILILIRSIMPKITEAVDSIDAILEASAKVDPFIEEYEKKLKEQRQGISDSIYESLEEDLMELKRYQMSNNDGYNFTAMKEILKQNLSILSITETLLMDGEQAMVLEEYHKARQSFSKAGEGLSNYQLAGLTIDYSSLVLRKETDIDPLDSISTLILEGLTGLVMDPETISDAEISKELLPSDLAALSDIDSNEEDTGFDFGSFFGSLVIGGKNSNMGGLFNSFGDINVSSMIGEGINKAAEHLLFRAYLQEHFYTFPSEGADGSIRKPSVLAYEQEYLLIGKNTDKDNLVSVITKIIFLRTILDFTSLLGDKAKCTEAKALAASLVGFTGLPILITITQTIIMILLAFAEALVDTSALLMGKEIPLLKNKIKYNIPDLIVINRSNIQSKAASYPDKDPGLCLSYSDYINVFLFFKNKKELCYRSMDLIQENLRIRYKDTFTFSNCLYGFNVEAGFVIKPKFISIPLVHKYISQNSKFGYKIQVEYSY